METGLQTNTEWHPRYFKRFIRKFETSTGVALIMTDEGEAYIKAMGNNEGPHALVREFIGTSVAKMVGLPTFEFALMNICDGDEIDLGHNLKALPGTAFLTKAQSGNPWSGEADDLKSVENTDVIPLMVVIDTLLLNSDRFPPPMMRRNPHFDNVFLSAEDASRGKFRLIAMDYSHCLYTGNELKENIRNTRYVKDEQVYGLFPAFNHYITNPAVDICLERLKLIDKGRIADILARVPWEWGVSIAIKDAICDLLVDRAVYLREHITRDNVLYRAEQGELGLLNGGNHGVS